MNARLAFLLLCFVAIIAAEPSDRPDSKEVGESDGELEHRAFFGGIGSGFLVTLLAAVPIKISYIVVGALILYAAYVTLGQITPVVFSQPVGMARSLTSGSLQTATRMAGELLTGISSIDNITGAISVCHARAVCDLQNHMINTFPNVTGYLLSGQLVSLNRTVELLSSIIIEPALRLYNVSSCEEVWQQCDGPSTGTANFPLQVNSSTTGEE